MKFSIEVEPDDVEQGKWMVVIRNVDDRIVIVPCRKLTKATALKMKPACWYAFDAGARQFRLWAYDTVANERIDLDTP